MAQPQMPDPVQLAQGFADLSHVAANIAAEMQHLPNWGPAAQQALLQQLLQGQQQLQQGQQQLQQGQQQLQQKLQQMAANAHTRTLNMQANPDDTLRWLVNDAGQIPNQAPMTVTEVRTATGNVLDGLLAHYGLPLQGAVPLRRRALLQHMGKLG
jgi:uncharacterized phage infection (PIP) family protein YhgE